MLTVIVGRYLQGLVGRGGERKWAACGWVGSVLMLRRARVGELVSWHAFAF